MVPVVFLSTFWDVIWGSLIIFFIIIPIVMLWFFALMDLFSRRDIRWKKVLWLLFIVFVPLFGTIVYLLVRPEEEADIPPQAPA
jgi:hypothetical protein